LRLLEKDIINTARKFNVKVDEKKVSECLRIFKELFFSTNYIQFRVAKKNDLHQFNWRSEYYQPDMNTPEVLQKIFTLQKDAPGVQGKVNTNLIISELGRNFPTVGLGVDFEPSRGLVKLWHFGRHTVQDMIKLEHVPKAVAQFIPIISKFGLSRVYCTGVDYEKDSMNLYFLWSESGKKKKKDVIGVLKALDFPPPAENIIESCKKASCLAVTFRCDTDKIERVCFYIPHLWQNTEYLEKEPFTSHIQEHILPTVVEDSASDSFVGCSIGKDSLGNLDFYMKLESDYFNSYFFFFK